MKSDARRTVASGWTAQGAGLREGASAEPTPFFTWMIAYHTATKLSQPELSVSVLLYTLCKQFWRQKLQAR
eukprot:675144-Pleurochrysis_carterae.AAC.3